MFVHTPARGGSHMGLGADSCGSCASQLGAAPGARESAAWLQSMGGSFIVDVMGKGAARTRPRGSHSTLTSEARLALERPTYMCLHVK